MKLLYRYGLGGLLAVAVALAVTGAARADSMFVSNANISTVGEYTTAGATVNASLISGLDFPVGLAVSGSDLFVANNGDGTIGEYTTSGTLVSASLISGLSGPTLMAIVPSTPTASEPGSLLLLATVLAGFGLIALAGKRRAASRSVYGFAGPVDSRMTSCVSTTYSTPMLVFERRLF